MRVYIIGPVYPFRGGISHSNTLLCENLSKKHYLKVLSFKRMFPSFLYPGRDQKEVTKKNISLNVEYIIDSINPVTWIKTFFMIKKEKTDFLIFQWWTPFFTPSFFVIASLTRLFTKTKISIICQNVLSHERAFLDLFLTKLFFITPHLFIVLSKQDIKVLKSIMPNARVRYLIEPTYEKVFKANELSKSEAKRILDLKTRVILFFGVIRDYKGLTYLIKAMPEILGKIEVKLLIVGEFWQDKKKYIEEIEGLKIAKNVRIIDRYVSDEEAILYFSAADVVVLPYISSTESGVIQLAYGLNKPIITTNVGGNPDLIENNKTGLIVPPKDVSSLANVIIAYFKYDMEEKFREEMKKRMDIFRWNDEKEKILFEGI